MAGEDGLWPKAGFAQADPGHQECRASPVGSCTLLLSPLKQFPGPAEEGLGQGGKFPWTSAGWALD